VAEMTEILRQSETIFKNTLIAGMCIPEVLETQSAPFRNYEDIIQMIDNGWRAIQQLFRVVSVLCRSDSSLCTSGLTLLWNDA